ncbi:hypothetical protein NBRC110019_21050 [Neptunitalea chrysea]|uniref:Alpha-2-macroglobulin domain-containing protein n=1 Tax=Neptunitalea chrysea TaxID=1647581 RepID=A0A9W6B5R4_9FLAO|nr:TonB-dependent receptor plug domain-containing protein [Neptunitalea chrysea]GLB53065.1 hypothetical protein NBRC110019_21050 [Neptunitalea chrysea]
MSLKKIVFAIGLVIIFSFKSNDPKPHSLLEKIYTQTDRPLYFPGETIWFKSYVTNVKGKVSQLSDVMVAELISPKGGVVQTFNYAISQGAAYGNFYIHKDWVGGVYKIRTYTNWMRNYSEEAFFEKEVVIQKVVSPNLLMKLDFERKAYGKGAEVTANLEVNDLENAPLANRMITYKMLMDGAVYISEEVTTDTAGKVQIHFPLPKDLQTTDVLLNVQIPYKGSREAISRSVPVTLNKIDLQLLPESGTAILGVQNTIAFKAVNEFGKPADVSGDIVDDKGTVVTHFTSFHDGMGSFDLLPKTTSYFARITAPFVSDSLIALPKIETNGTRFHVTENEQEYVLKIFSNQYSLVQVIVADAYQELSSEKVATNLYQAVYKIRKKDLSTGIIKITIKNITDAIIAERLLFNNQPNQLKVSVSLNKKVYKTRDKVKVTVTTTDSLNQPIPANLSVSVTDNALVTYADDKQDNILSYLLVSSELHGKIYKPSFYFDPKEPEAIKALDYVMLTHGWRNYITKPVYTSTAEFTPNSRSIQAGKVVDADGKGIQSHLLLFDLETNWVEVFDTDENGAFLIKHFKTGSFKLLAYTNEGQKVAIQLGKLEMGNMNPKNKQTSKELDSGIEYKHLQKPLQSKVDEKVNTPVAVLTTALEANSEALDEVVVIGYGIQRSSNLTGCVQVVSRNELDQIRGDDVSSLLQRKVAGVQVTGNGNDMNQNTTIRIRGGGSVNGNRAPLYVLDGAPIGDISNIEPSEIDNITVLSGSNATSLYGSRGGNGVIVINTKNGYNRMTYGMKKFHSKRFQKYAFKNLYLRAPALTVASQFYSPVYESKEIAKERTDFRNTLYWNPVVQTDANGKASFEFYTSDAISSFVITTEGIGYNGLIGRDETKFGVKKPVNVTVVTPAYMALNDKVQIPVTLTNNTDKEITVGMEVQLPESLQLVTPLPSNYTVAANGYQVVYTTVTPVQKTDEGVVRITVKGEGYTDTLEKKVAVISPYFPTSASVSGSNSRSFEFSVDNAVPGSVKAQFTVYTDVVGTVMDGIEGIMREPYGCFEQVSSTTYPNVLVLQYLRETGKSNPEIEEKALDYIKKGYKKLAAYETKQDGFEWYGDTPPHEALSAYGLMEFTEMKEIYNGVDEAMLARTKKFLLSRKDGKGGFKQNKGKYGFSSAPYRVNNAYIVYALSESGLPVAEYEFEYNTAIQEALDSNDTYRLALVTCASINLKKTDKSALLLKRLKTSITEYGFEHLPVENTITRSYYGSASVETAAFTVMALLKQGDDPYLVSKGIAYLVSKRKHGRFGSTQATSMALKALIAYTKEAKSKLLKTEDVALTINGHTFQRSLKVNKEGKIVIDSLAPYITNGVQTASVAFSNDSIVFPYQLQVLWDATVPNSAPECKVGINTKLVSDVSKIGESVRMNIQVTNTTHEPLPMVTAVVGIPSGTQAEPWQLKEIAEKQQADFVEVFDNYLVFYWKEFDKVETKEIHLDLKTIIPGTYTAPASTAYLYYTDEFKHWVKGKQLIVEE